MLLSKWQKFRPTTNRLRPDMRLGPWRPGCGLAKQSQMSEETRLARVTPSLLLSATRVEGKPGVTEKKSTKTRPRRRRLFLTFQFSNAVTTSHPRPKSPVGFFRFRGHV